VKVQDWQRRLLAIVLSFLGLAAVVGVAGAAPAQASVNSCTVSHYMEFSWVGNTSDGYTGVSRTESYQTIPYTLDCDKPYEGHNSTCFTGRLIMLYSPTTGASNVFGPWVRTCWTPVAMASQWGGWVHKGDYIFFEARAEQDGGTTPNGWAFY
jgi:hypothetical protein